MIIISGNPTQEIKEQIKEESIICGAFVFSINALKDIRAKIQNLYGGDLHDYSHMIEKTTKSAIEKLKHKAINQGWDGIHSLEIATPSVTDRAAEIVLIGTAYKL